MEPPSAANTARRPIRVLPESVILKIAAGEAIERPSSVVKELIENSIDAGASRIEVRIADGGRRTISVTDDGNGMTADEAEMALQRHATSKLESFDDLELIRTLGFRGEALSSIAAVSHLELMTCALGSHEGTRLHCEGGRIHSVEPFGTPPGTTIGVSHLFFNTPARKKFMRAKSTEAGHIENAIRRVGLAEIGKTLLYEADGEVRLHLPETIDLFERLQQMYGKKIADQLVPFSGHDGGLRIFGFVSQPTLTFSRAEEVWCLVNRRPIRDRMLTAAVMEGYRSALMERRYPLAVVHIDIPPSRVDVNVHPTKAEVRFADSQPIFRLLAKTIAQAVGRPSSVAVTSTPMVASDRRESYEPRPIGGESVLQTVLGIPSSRETEPPPLPFVETSGRFAALDILGTLDDTYLICREAEGLILIDQHAAHERVKYERLQEAVQRGGTPEAQLLLTPLTMEVSGKREAALERLGPLFKKLGFDVDLFGGRTFVVKSVPAVMGNHDPRPLLGDLADDLANEEPERAWRNLLDQILSRIACHSAVRAHDRLGSEEIRALLSDMDRVNLATNCPHGRPTYLRFAIGDLERLFHRK